MLGTPQWEPFITRLCDAVSPLVDFDSDDVRQFLLEKVQSENIRSYIEEAATNIHYLVYEDDEDETLEETGMSDPVTEAA